MILLTLILVALLTGYGVNGRRCNKNPQLLIISLDGFRWDYLRMYRLPAFNYLKSIGSHADFIYNNYVTSTFPNHFSMVTGLHQESHGIINSVMHDPKLNKTFALYREEDHNFEWFGQKRDVEPIWTTNQLAGRNRASLVSWPGSHVTFMNESVEEIPFNYHNDFKTLINRFIRHFTATHRPVNFGAIYINQPDGVGHEFGPYSIQMKKQLRYLDSCIVYLLKKLKLHGLLDTINVILTSDHGMEKLEGKHQVYLSDYVDTSFFDSYGTYHNMNLFMKNSKLF